MKLYFFIFIPILIASIIYILPGKLSKYIAVVTQSALFIYSIYNFIFICNNGEIIETLGGWERFAGITLKADRLSSVFLILTTMIFLVCFIFGLMQKFMNRLFVFIFIILQSLIATMFLSYDLFNIYIVAEISTIAVGILIMFKRDSRSIYDGMVYLLTNIVGMTFFLFGTGFIYKYFGSFDIGLIQEKIIIMENKQALVIPFAFLVTGIGLKCAIMPLFSWLPKAHGTPSAPSIVSAVLSGLYVKCGLYLFIRIRHMFLPGINMDNYFLVIGLVTGIIGFMLAISQKDIKLILAYHTISQIGLILSGICMGNEYSYWGAVFHIFNHAIFKSVLFLTAGIIIECYGTRDIYKIRGVFKRMPVVSCAAIMAILGITGAPLFNGSISKYLIQSGVKGSITDYIIIVINLGTIISFVKYSTIFKPDKEKKFKKYNTGILQKAAVVLMGTLCFIMGITGAKLIYLLFDFTVKVDIISYMEKAFIFFLSLGLGYFAYDKILKKSEWLKKGVSVELGFNAICALICCFFFVTFIIGTIL